MKRRYYHASPARFKRGDHISAGSSSVVGRNYQFSLALVYMTNSPYVHFTVIDKAVENGWNVYEVVPIGKVYRGMWDEWMALEVEVVKKVGTVGELGTGLAKFASEVARSRNGQFFPKIRKKEKKKKDKDLGSDEASIVA